MYACKPKPEHAGCSYSYQLQTADNDEMKNVNKHKFIDLYK